MSYTACYLDIAIQLQQATEIQQKPCETTVALTVSFTDPMGSSKKVLIALLTSLLLFCFSGLRTVSIVLLNLSALTFSNIRALASSTSVIAQTCEICSPVG